MIACNKAFKVFKPSSMKIFIANFILLMFNQLINHCVVIMSLNLQGHYSNIIVNIQSVINRGKRNNSIKSYGKVGEGMEQLKSHRSMLNYS